MTRHAWIARLSASALILGAPATAVAQDVTCKPGDVEVVGLTFAGNRAFSSASLAAGIVTTPSSWSRRKLRFFGTARCLDRPQFALDAVRLLLFYRNHGYVAASVDTSVTAAGARRVAIGFRIAEGLPVLISELVLEGLEGVDVGERVRAGLATARGAPFDKYAMEESRDSLSRRLRNSGYPDAEVFVGFDTHAAAHTAAVRFTVLPGRRAVVGPLRVSVTPREGAKRGLDDRAVRRVAGIADGDLYSAERLERAKRALYQTDAYDQVSVRTDTTSEGAEAGRIGVTLDLAEGFMRTARAAVGYGTLDCFRASGDVTQYNFLGGAARLDVNTRVSKLGISEPLSGAASLCPQAKADPYSKDLNYYVGASASRTAVFREFAPSVTIYSERRSEYNAFLRTTPIGSALAFARTLGRTTQTFGYAVEYGRTEAQPALLCAVFQQCEQADRDAFSRTQRLAVASVAFSRETGDSPVSPTRGSVIRFELRTAGTHTGSDRGLQFNKVLFDGAVYRPFTADIVLAARVRVGAVVGSSLSFTNAALYVPPQERLFAGGPTTVRGFPQNQLGPAVYIAASYDTVRANGTVGGSPANPGDTVYFRTRGNTPGERTVPTGGNAMVVANLEARFRSPFLSDALQWTAFADVGEVWNRGTPGANLGFSAMRWSPGVGMRVRTIIGFLRLDLAYNPYQRPAGAAYFDTPVSVGGALLCVSPGNTLRVTTAANGQSSQSSGSCPGTFLPPRESAFLRRLQPSISIGQAF